MILTAAYSPKEMWLSARILENSFDYKSIYRYFPDFLMSPLQKGLEFSSEDLITNTIPCNIYDICFFKMLVCHFSQKPSNQSYSLWKEILVKTPQNHVRNQVLNIFKANIVFIL